MQHFLNGALLYILNLLYELIYAVDRLYILNLFGKLNQKFNDISTF